MKTPRFWIAWKKMSLGAKLGIIFPLIYILLHFAPVQYRDKTMIGFVLEPLPDLFQAQRDIVILGWADLETSLGTIRVKPFYRVNAIGHNIRYFEGRNFRIGRAEHNISILGNILENPGFSFEWDDIKAMAFNQIMDIQGQLIHAVYAYPRYNENGEMVDIVINFKGNPDMTDNIIVLSDGTEIGFGYDYQELFFIVQSTAVNTWIIGIDGRYRHFDYFFVTRSEGAEPEKFVEITFEENWGKFIVGVPYEGR